MKIRKQFLILTLLVLPSASSVLLLTGCSKPAPPPMATQTPAEMNQSVKDQAAKYKAFRESHPNAYQPQSGGQ